jgi:2-keto-4-pentenoate hydratase/2-oxohepta-3-ene-1,7-dioic acid hydratase in catechol pathway
MLELTLPSPERVVPAGKLLCIGRNYAKHAAEMKAEVPEEPVVFMKPSTALVGTGGTIFLPARTQEVHHEVELVAIIGRGGKHIPEQKALDHVAAYAVGLDMTARDLQDIAKKKGLPWTIAKGFDTFAPLGPLMPASDVDDPQNLALHLRINGELRQEGHTRDMLFPVARLIAYCSSIFTLMPGDLLYTGTPDGVGPVQPGDKLEATIDGFPPLRVKVKREG